MATREQSPWGTKRRERGVWAEYGDGRSSRVMRGVLAVSHAQWVADTINDELGYRPTRQRG